MFFLYRLQLYLLWKKLLWHYYWLLSLKEVKVQISFDSFPLVDPIDSLQTLFYYWYLENPDYIIGDINSDTIINVLDIIQIVNIILGNSIPNSIQFLSADLNSDGIIDILDIILLVSLILN